jgi:DUF2971 family protein
MSTEWNLLLRAKLAGRKVLYHYASTEAAISIIRSRTLRATSIHHMNDAREFEHALDVVRNQLRILRDEQQPTDAPFFEAFEEWLTRDPQLNIHAFCLSEHDDQLSQWRAYCRGGGYALGFDPERLARLMGEQNGFRMARCIYAPEEQDAKARESLQGALSVFRQSVGRGEGVQKAISTARGLFFPGFVLTAPFFKDPAFTEEAEWRLVEFQLDPDDPRLNFRSAPDFIVPYLECQLEELPLVNVVVGPTPEPELARVTMERMLRRFGVKYQQVSRSNVPYRGL